MNMFPSAFDSIPKNRSDLVNDLELPDVTVSPFVWSPEESLSSWSLDEDDETASSDSSLALSRAMTDSEIDYGRARRLRKRSLTDPWAELRTALHSFPPEYLECVNSFSCEDECVDTESNVKIQGYNEELCLRMERFFEEECRVFSPDDQSLIALEEALKSCDVKVLDLEGSLPYDGSS